MEINSYLFSMEAGGKKGLVSFSSSGVCQHSLVWWPFPPSSKPAA